MPASAPISTSTAARCALHPLLLLTGIVVSGAGIAIALRLR
ncbi:hypothetical protein [Nostoc sp. ChiQUE01b]|nr:hypothetical protein [Nostoc sp. ChiQUE01b]